MLAPSTAAATRSGGARRRRSDRASALVVRGRNAAGLNDDAPSRQAGGRASSASFLGVGARVLTAQPGPTAPARSSSSAPIVAAAGSPTLLPAPILILRTRAHAPSRSPQASTSPSNIPGRSNSGSASSRSTGCRRRCRSARIAAIGRRSSPITSATCSPRSSASSPRPTSRCRIATTTNMAACSSRSRSR